MRYEIQVTMLLQPICLLICILFYIVYYHMHSCVSFVLYYYVHCYFTCIPPCEAYTMSNETCIFFSRTMKMSLRHYGLVAPLFYIFSSSPQLHFQKLIQSFFYFAPSLTVPKVPEISPEFFFFFFFFFYRHLH